MSSFCSVCPDPAKCRCYENMNPPQMYPSYPNTSPFHYTRPASYAFGHQPSSYPQPPLAGPVPQFVNNFASTYATSSSTHPATSFPSPALGDSTNTVNSDAAPTRKRKRTSKKSAGNSKRQKTTTSPPVHGAGPIPSIPAESHGSLADSERTTSHTAASHIWYFVRGVNDNKSPSSKLPYEKPKPTRPKEKEFSHITCTLCDIPQQWHVWLNKGSSGKAILQHLRAHHEKSWQDLVIAQNLKGAGELREQREQQNQPRPRDKEPFSLDGFYKRLLRWMVVDDQSMNVVDCEELRDLLLYIGRQLDDSDIPHRTRISELITTAFQEEYAAMIADLQNSLGRVSFTTDTWSRTNLESYMAVTAHYTVRDQHGLKLRSELVAFRLIQGSHAGEHLGREFVAVLKDIGCLHKIGMITADNASNNNTMMEQLEEELDGLGIAFNRDGNRIRCFPHVINLAVGTALEGLLHPPNPFPQPNPTLHPNTPTPAPNSEDAQRLESGYREDYQEALESDLVTRVRSYVTAVRSSGQRREKFISLIEAGNEDGGFGSSHTKLRVVGLLKDMKVRWSSLFKMIDRFLELYPACEQFIDDDWDFSGHIFSETDVEVLVDVRDFLYIFHMVQEVVSSQKTPTLSMVLPLYEELIILLSGFSKRKPQLAHAVERAISKLNEYLDTARKTKMYALAIVLNPTVKFEWLEKNWNEADYLSARDSVFKLLLEYQRDRRSQSSPTTLPETLPTGSRHTVHMPSTSKAAYNLGSGMARLRAYKETLDSDLARLNDSSTSPSTDSEHNDRREEDPLLVERRDRKAVQDEINRYETAGCLRADENFDIMSYWQEHASDFPLLYRSALDVLPVQASAVPCERVFSSSKETDRPRRSNMEDPKMQQLQILKYRVRNDRLSFTDELLCTDYELSTIDLEPEVIDELIASGRVTELHEYIAQSWQTWGLYEGSEGSAKQHRDDDASNNEEMDAPED